MSKGQNVSRVDFYFSFAMLCGEDDRKGYRKLSLISGTEHIWIKSRNGKVIGLLICGYDCVKLSQRQ